MKSPLIPLMFMIFFALVVFLIDLYVFRGVKSLSSSLSVNWQNIVKTGFWIMCTWAYLSILAYAFADYRHWPGELRRWFMGMALIFFATKIIILPFFLGNDIVGVFKWIYAKIITTPESISTAHTISRAGFLQKTGLLVGSTFFGTLLYGMARTAYQFTIRTEKVKIKDLPDEFAGLRIVQVSDMHLGSFGSTEPIERVVKLINGLQADLVFFTGDLVNDKAVEVEPYENILGKIESKKGIFSTLGNHDYGDYHEWPSAKSKAENLQDVKNWHAHFGWKMLNNANHIMEQNGKKLAIIGVENLSHSHAFSRYGDLKKAFAGAEDADVKLLLSHDPSHWDYEVSQDSAYKDISLTFSGHTHGFQFGVEIPKWNIKWSPSKYIYPHWAGLYRNTRDQYLYVTRGVGFLGYYGRVGILPEITMIELEKA